MTVPGADAAAERDEAGSAPVPAAAPLSLAAVGRDFGLYFADVVARAGVVFAFTLLVANWLTPAEYGQATNAVALGRLVIILALVGLNQGYVVLYRTQSTEAARNELLFSTHVLATVSILIVAVLLGILWRPISDGFLDAAPWPLYFLPIVGMIAGGVLTELNSVRLRFAFRSRLVVGAGIAYAVVYPLLATGLLFGTELGAASLVWASAIGMIVVALAVYRRVGSPFRRRRLIDLSRLLRISVPLGLASLTTILPVIISRAILARQAGMTEVGIYSLTTSFVQPVLFVVAAFATAWSPHMAEHFDRPDFGPQASRVTALIAAAAIVGALFTQLAADVLLPIVILHEELHAAADLTGLLAWVTAMRVLASILAVGYIYRERSIHAIWVNGAGIAAGGVVAFMLAPALGALGVVLGEMIGMLTGLVLGAWVSHRITPVALPFARLAMFTLMSAGLLLAGLVFGTVALHSFALAAKDLLLMVTAAAAAWFMFRRELSSILEGAASRSRTWVRGIRTPRAS